MLIDHSITFRKPGPETTSEAVVFVSHAFSVRSSCAEGVRISAVSGSAVDETGAPPTVLIVDDDPTYGAFVSDALARAGFAGRQVATGAEAIALAHRERPAAVILDVILPGASGYEICHELRDEHGADLPIVFVSGVRTEPADRVAGLLVGGDDYLVKPFDPDELIARVRRLLAKSTAKADDARTTTSFSALTSRELEVLRLLAQGLNQDEIAGRLFISPSTVGSHIQRIVTKLGVHSRAHAVALAYRERLLEPA
jgi:DNA-binding NarL/FixJ family response regulator